MPNKKTDKMTLKKAVYIILTMIMGATLGCLAFGIAALWCAKSGPIPTFVFWIMILAGVISGFFLGFRWWRIVYIEHRHWRLDAKKKNHK